MTAWSRSLIIALIYAGAVLAAGTPTPGDTAPGFELNDQYGDSHALRDYRGQWLALYFYPKDDTPGCTTEACNFRDNIYAFRRIGAKVVGVSVDSVESHRKFADKYRIPFTILADPEAEVARRYGVLRDSRIGKIAARQSFLIDPDGRIVKHYAEVDPETHTEEVLADLKTFMKAGPGQG